jgi:UDP-N-acetylmuramate dehydrogenase
MKTFTDYCLRNHNTFKINVRAAIFAEYDTDEEIINYILKHDGKFQQVKLLILGEGSNLLFTDDFYGMVLHPKTNYISVISQDDEYYFVEAAAGVIWDKLVEYSIDNGAFGLENLSLIPGTVGASAVQNIGAYGVEASDFIHAVKYINLCTSKIESISGIDCKFSYRDSIFKSDFKNKALILSVTYKLNKTPKVKSEYADIKSHFNNKTEITPHELRDAVVNIRRNKLPDTEIIGNAGSFFKNPVVDKYKFEILLSKFPDLRYYNLDDGFYKLAAGWLIDKCGLKGFECNGAAVHENQALVLINKSGNAQGKDVLALAEIIQRKIKENFDVNLEPEVIII